MSNFNFKRNLSFTKEYFIVHLKTFKEYKTNLYLGIFAHLTFMIIISFSFFVLKEQFSEIFYWNLNEFALYLILMELFLFFFHPWFRGLRVDLLTGKFNAYLTRPVSLFLHQSLANIKMDTILFSLIYMLALIIYFAFIDINFNLIRATVTMGFSFLGGVFLMNVRCFLNSLAFFIKENGFLGEIYFGNFTNAFSYYPISFFKNNSIRYFGLIVGVVYYATLPTDFYFGYIGYKELFDYFLILMGMIVVLIISSYFLWKKGLEKYEGYN
ncbi:MAG: ABC-2 family transporter protein [Candidatus Woesearchaeota archaeon]|jgi:ABC-type uncharacterized transport system permease subunit|nr:ABC-2 family transporter protein [Candidatus Woesearchaeota archaeon]